MLQLLLRDSLDGSDRVFKGTFHTQMANITSSSHSSSHSNSGSGSGSLPYDNKQRDEGKINTARDIESDLCHVVLICIGLLQVVCSKFNLPALVDGINWSHAYTGYAVETLTSEEQALLGRRYMLQQLHRIAIIPGFLDLAKVRHES